MHFWIDKRSQTAFGRPRVSASLAHSNGIGFSNPNNRRLRGKSMVTPIHRFPAPRQPQSTAQPTMHHHHHHHQIHNHTPASHASVQIHSAHNQQQQLNNQMNLQRPQSQVPAVATAAVHQPAAVVAQASPLLPQPHNNYHIPVSVHNIYEPTAHELDQSMVEISSILQQSVARSQDQQLLPFHLKCGMWASLALATVFVAGAKFYFDHQDTGLEVLIFCAFSATFFMTACGVSLCKRPIDSNVGPIYDHTLNSDQNSLQHTSDQVTASVVTANPQPNNVIVAPPPPYHIAILLPENIKEIEETPPPSYDKIVI